jgi:hypothetical protein
MGKAGVYAALGFELAGLVIAFIYIGQWFDEKLGYQGLGTAIGAFLAMGLWIYHIWWVTRGIEKEESSDGSP